MVLAALGDTQVMGMAGMAVTEAMDLADILDTVLADSVATQEVLGAAIRVDMDSEVSTITGITDTGKNVVPILK